jgi:peptidoglycan hydrolase-like protein with peptidoglycan-binding domain
VDYRQKKIFGGIAILVTSLWLAPCPLGANVKPGGKADPHKRSQAGRNTLSGHGTSHAAARKTGRVSASRRRALSRRQMRAQIHLMPTRVEEIQDALKQAGYLDEEPSGQWDSRTREAMRHYQLDHHFQVTGLPEAKSLMKLGLGPHALPADLDTTAGTRASVDSAAGVSPRSDSPASIDPSTSTPQPRD